MARDLKVHFFEFPDDRIEAVREAFEGCRNCVPIWLHRLNFYFKSEYHEENVMMQCSVDHEYRQAHIRIYLGWFENPDRQRCEHLLHELLHISFSPVANLFDRLLDLGGHEGPIREHLREEFRQRMEGCMEDMSQSFAVIRPDLPKVHYATERYNAPNGAKGLVKWL